MVPRIPLLSGIARLAPRYDGFVLDVWGVLHDGVRPYPGAVDALRALDDAGKRFVLLSNAPRRGAVVTRSMIAMGVPEAYCAGVVSSGEAAWRALRRRDDPWYARLGRRCLHIGPTRDEGLLDGLDLERAERAEEADFILNTGPWFDEERVQDYEGRLRRAAAARLPMICANPDLEVIRGGRRIVCAGALAERYEALGGDVRYLGKPHPAIYVHCLERLAVADRRRIVAVGDSLRTDIAGAERAGLDAVLVVGGIHGEELGWRPGAAPDEAAVAELCAREGRRPVAAVAAFAW